MKTALTIAGSDSSGGAGIQADIKTITCNGVFAMSAITALTAQNTTGVQGVFEISADFVYKQIESAVTDIPPDAVKIGMVSSPQIIEKIAAAIRDFNLKNIVVDPVMVATSGSSLIKNEAICALQEKLFPAATLITPNIPESEVLSGIKIKNAEDMETAGKIIFEKFDCNVLVKGGHSLNDANDLLITKGKKLWLNGIRVENPNTHGTGCTLSSAIAANLAKGFDITESVQNAKDYITKALRANLNLGHGSGPLQHFV